jgi:hypothetical protein
MSNPIDSKAQLWAKRLREFESSSLNVAQFCQSIGCSEPNFYQWKKKLNATTKVAPKAQFLQVQTEPCSSIEIRLVSGIVITIPAAAIDTLPLILERVA